MYADMLNRAVAAMKQGKHLNATDLTQPLGIGTEINLRTPALLPDGYCPDVHERLTLYKRLANGDSTEDIDALQEELIDRFGELPIQAQSLLATHRLRLLVKPLLIQKLDANNDQVTIQFSPEFSKNPPIEPIKIINLIQKNRSYKLAGQDKISLLRHCPTLNDKVTAVKDMIRELTK
jgi:transcription-repair coupling factor (superfamily II helicase)